MDRETIAELHQLWDPRHRDRLRQVLGTARGPIRQVHVSFPAVPEIEFGETMLSAPWVVGTEASPWLLVDREGRRVLSSEMPEATEALIRELAGESVESLSVAPERPDLIVNLSDGRSFLIESKADETNLPAWELSTPQQQVLSVGPGPYWLQYQADVPERDIPWLRHRWIASADQSVAEEESALVASSVRHQEWSQRLRRALAVVALTLIVVALVVNLEPDTALALSNVLVALGLLGVLVALLRARL